MFYKSFKKNKQDISVDIDKIPNLNLFFFGRNMDGTLKKNNITKGGKGNIDKKNKETTN